MIWSLPLPALFAGFALEAIVVGHFACYFGPVLEPVLLDQLPYHLVLLNQQPVTISLQPLCFWVPLILLYTTTALFLI